ncbi:MAG: 4-(cytidine 5'-diphospho)-2-C-methyl-D-erythritol kinase [Candidatus Binatia bacterium]|nr:4-(cytidine 5'-diphospho)-2-C-methyl-D-erythritol kinase [Candidatus Binatia bacterium]
MAIFQVWSPAKVNLVLYLRGRREDGFHLIESLVAPVSLFDRITIELGTASSSAMRCEVESTGFPVPRGEENLVSRAVAAYEKAVRRPLPTVRVRLEKFIPVGAGLGGGSSNAAALLVLLQRIFKNPLNDLELTKVGASVGADVPFFLSGRPAILRGVGEQIEPVALPQTLHLVLCSDGSSLLTKDVYAEARRSLTVFSRVSNIGAFLEGKLDLVNALQNDLEAAAIAMHPGIEQMKRDVVTAGAAAGLMTGSGSCVFGVCRSRAHARRVAEILSARGYWAVPVQTLTQTWIFCYWCAG